MRKKILVLARIFHLHNNYFEGTRQNNLLQGKSKACCRMMKSGSNLQSCSQHELPICLPCSNNLHCCMMLERSQRLNRRNFRNIVNSQLGLDEHLMRLEEDLPGEVLQKVDEVEIEMMFCILHFHIRLDRFQLEVCC